MPEESEEFVICDCHAHALSISWWKEEKELFLSMWYRGKARFPFLSRCGYALRALRGDTGPDELVFNVENAKVLKAKIEEFLREVEG